jgi:hypothetical protein
LTQEVGWIRNLSCSLTSYAWICGFNSGDASLVIDGMVVYCVQVFAQLFTCLLWVDH